MKSNHESAFLQILQEELVPALGCTEPIAVAYASSKAREVLGTYPTKIHMQSSGSLLKNIKCVTVPNTKCLCGVEASIFAGLVAGNPDKGLQVLEDLNQNQIQEIKDLKERIPCEVTLLDTPLNLHFILRFDSYEHHCEIEVQNLHTNIIRISKDDQIIYEANKDLLKYYGILTDRSFFTVRKIHEFIETAPIEDLKIILSPQADLNYKIALNGLNGDFGVQIGNAILSYDQSIYGKMKAYAAAASEARMCGDNSPVITNSGSGNQGIATSVPVVVYCKEKQIPEEKMYRALALSNLLTIYQKNFIGRLSAFCGAISASVGSGVALTYLENGSIDQIEMTVTNALADASGIVCDGAKASCASKIASSLESAFIAHFIAMKGKAYEKNTGLIRENADQTIEAIGRLANDGMKYTNEMILNLMLNNCD